MKLFRVKIDGFRSIKEPLELAVDGRVTVLIGANDVGKTNLLRTVQALNDDVEILPSDRNWDMSDETIPVIEWHFLLEPEERKSLIDTLTKSLQQPTLKVSIQDNPGRNAIDIVETLIGTSAEDGQPLDGQISTTTTHAFANEVVMRRKTKSVVEIDIPAPFNTAEIGLVLLKQRPRVELFMPAEQLTDSITLSDLESPSQEFMQGIFRYAGIWEDRAKLFQQTPATEKQLERASDVFTDKIRKDWQQGENLSFKLRHGGTNGDHIQLLIEDPAVAERFVRPSERSEGFSSFFKMSMRLRARTEATKARSYIFLFDEPGTALYPAGQINLQRVFERLSDENQIVYCTHSLFMINHNRPQRNRVISKTSKGTKIDQKPFLKNWRAVRQSLGLLLAGTFFIADRTLLVEGESDAMYVGDLLAACDRADLIDVDLNLFSVQWAGNARDFGPMARLLVDEGREVVAMVDGDKGGQDLSRGLEKLNESIAARAAEGIRPVVLVAHPNGASIEDILPFRDKYFESVVSAAHELLAGQFRELAAGVSADSDGMLSALKGTRATGVTLGRHVENVTKTWFTCGEPISKLAIARHYGTWLQQASLKDLGFAVPGQILQLIDALRLGSKVTREEIFETTAMVGR